MPAGFNAPLEVSSAERYQGDQRDPATYLQGYAKWATTQAAASAAPVAAASSSAAASSNGRSTKQAHGANSEPLPGQQSEYFFH